MVCFGGKFRHKYRKNAPAWLISGQKRVARLESDVQTAQTDTELYAVRQRVNELYFGILLLDRKIELNRDLQTLLQSNLDKLSAMLAQGAAMQSDVSTVKAERLKARQQAADLAYSRKSLADVMAVFIGREFADLATPQDPAPVAQENHRPELRLFDTQMRLADSREALLKARLRPRLSVFAQGQYGYPGYDMFEAMFDHDWKLNAMVGARLTWNIGALYTHRNDRARINTSRGMTETARETFLFNNRMQEVRQTDGVAKYRQMVGDDSEIVALRGEVRRAAEAKLEHGIIDTDNLLQEITRENQSRIDLTTHTIIMLKESYDLKYTTNN